MKHSNRVPESSSSLKYPYNAKSQRYSYEIRAILQKFRLKTYSYGARSVDVTRILATTITYLNSEKCVFDNSIDESVLYNYFIKYVMLKSNNFLLPPSSSHISICSVSRLPLFCDSSQGVIFNVLAAGLVPVVSIVFIGCVFHRYITLLIHKLCNVSTNANGSATVSR